MAENKEKIEEKKDTKTKTTKKKTATKKKETPQETRTDRQKSVKIELNEMIPVRSVTQGGLTYISPKTGFTVTWDEYGTEEYIEFSELLTMKASRNKFLSEPYLVIDDEDVVKKLGLTKLYEEMVDFDNLEDFFNQRPSTMEEKLEKLPRGIKKLIADKSRKMIQDGELFDIRKIKIIEKKLHLDLQMLMD